MAEKSKVKIKFFYLILFKLILLLGFNSFCHARNTCGTLFEEPAKGRRIDWKSVVSQRTIGALATTSFIVSFAMTPFAGAASKFMVAHYFSSKPNVVLIQNSKTRESLVQELIEGWKVSYTFYLETEKFRKVDFERNLSDIEALQSEIERLEKTDFGSN